MIISEHTYGSKKLLKIKGETKMSCDGREYEQVKTTYVQFEDYESGNTPLPTKEEALAGVKSCQSIPKLFSQIKAFLMQSDTPPINGGNAYIKDFGDTTETWTGRVDKTDNDKKIYCKWFYWGILPSNANLVSKPHGINVKNIYSCKGVATGYIFMDLPHVFPNTTNPVAVWANYTEIIINAGADRSKLTAWVYLEYTCTDR